MSQESPKNASARSLHPPSPRCAGPVLLAAALVITIGALAVAAEAPPLTVDSPSEGLLTRYPVLTVAGTTGPDTPVTVHVENAFGEQWKETSSLANGTYGVRVYLDWGRSLITVEAGCRDNGTTIVTRNVTVDLFDPYVEMRLEFLNSVPIPYDDGIGAYLVADAEVLVNGTCHDDHTSCQDLLVRLNGEPLDTGPDRRGRFLARVGLGPGLNDVTLEVTDLAGNRRTVTRRVVRDTEPPPVLVHRPCDDGVTRDPMCTVEGSTEPSTYVNVRVQSPRGSWGHNTTSDPDGTFRVPVGLFEGPQLVAVSTVDAVGNMNCTVLAITLDTTPPDLVVVSPQGGYAITRETRYTIVAALLDGGEAVVSIDGREMEGTDVFEAVVALREGTNVLEVVAVDVAGNERSVNITIERDTFPPTMRVGSPMYLDLVTNDPTLRFAGTVRGAAGVTVRHRGTAHQALLTSGSWEEGGWALDLDLGDHDLESSVEVYAHDAAGNRDVVTFHVVLDTVPPPLAIDGGPVLVTNRRTVRVTGTTEEGVVRLTVDGEDVPVDGGVFDVSLPLAEGVNTFPVRARDRAGNVARETLEVVYDPVPPGLELDYPRSTRERFVSVDGITDDDVVWVYVDGRSFFVDNGTFSFDIELVGEGVHQINFTVEDAAGNRRTEVIDIDYSTGVPALVPLLAAAAVAVATLAAVLLRRLRPGERR